MNPIANEVILASAGTGKTHALTSRILRLLTLGVAPEAMIALTFTRKAAGEFAAVTFRRLAAGARDPRRLAAELGVEADFSALLAALVRDMDRLQFRTFDAFFQRLVAAMPFDLGLPGGIEMIDETEAAELRDRVLARLLSADADPAAQQALLSAYREATFGAEEKGLRRRLEGFIRTNHVQFLECREAHRWGDAAGIWPNGCPWIEDIDARDEAAALETYARAHDGEVFRSLETIAVAAQTWEPGMTLPGGRVFEQLLELFSADPRASSVTLTYRKKEVPLDPVIVPALRRVVTRFVGGSLRRHLRIAAGVQRVLEPFDAAYHDEVRLSGRLSFADVVELLRRVPALDWQARLDARLDHWLFDEFQDTSLLQWSVVGNLLDEVLQDDSGRRSAFFVGDPKQSIYRWRGGEHRLIERILTHYRGALVERTLVKSYRSDPAIIDLVNRYGAAAADSANGLPSAVVDEWRRFWQPHESAAPHRTGHATVERLEDSEVLVDRVLADLRRIDPVTRGLTCAILTQKNEQARTLAHGLRERGFLHVVAETDEQIAMDAPVNRALVALVAAAAHPLDTASAALVAMSPLHALLREGGWPALRTWFFEEATKRGLEPTLRAALAQAGALADEFSRQRVRLLFELAREHDETGGSLDEFLRRAASHGRRQIASAANVQILTIHRSKGLGFDVVLLPVLDVTRMDRAPREGFLTWRGEHLRTVWLLHRPTADIAAMDPVLAAAHEQQVHDHAYDALCVWYVGLTRAKHALHVYTVAPGKSGGASPVALLHRALGGEEAFVNGRWESGGAD